MESDKASLAGWLLGPYGEAASYGPHRARRPGVSSPTVLHHTTPQNIDDLVTMTRTVAIASLDAARPGIDDLVDLLPRVVQVLPAQDAYGHRGFMAIDEVRMRLVDRVLALIVADYLTRPDDFAVARGPGSPARAIDPFIELDSREERGVAEWEHPAGGSSAFISALFSFIRNQLGSVLQAVLGWSVTLFSGDSSFKQKVLAGILVASLLWPLLVTGIFVPSVAAWAFTATPIHKFVGPGVFAWFRSCWRSSCLPESGSP